MKTSSFFNYPNEPASDSISDMLLLSDWPQHSWNRLLAYCQTVRFGAGEYVFHQGDTARAFYLVSAGQFELLLPRSRQPFRFVTVEPGALFGEQCFLDGEPQPFAARAMGEGELVRFSQTAYESFAAREAELAGQLIMDLARIVSLRLRHVATLLPETH